MKILAFDTSNKSLSVAILEDDTLLADLTLNIKKNHSVSLMPAIDFLMSNLELKPTDLERIVVAEGPGSYTGLRVAVATAKMLAYTLKIDLVGISSLYALATGFEDSDYLVVPLIDARRQNVYAGMYKNGEPLQADQHISLSALLAQLPNDEKLVFTGECLAFEEIISAEKPKALLKPSLPSAYAIGLLGKELPAVNVDAFTPEYLKRVEAEENWLKAHQAGDESHYIKRV